LREGALSVRGRPEFEETSRKKLQEASIARITARFDHPQAAYGELSPDAWIPALLRDLLTCKLPAGFAERLPRPTTLREACITVCSLPEFQLT
jgi:hypothetical protein